MTLVELLVVIFIIGILSGIALPTLINMVRKAKEPEAMLNIANSSKSQAPSYMEKGKFIIDIDKLNIAIARENDEYSSLVTTLASFASSSDVEFSSKESENYLYAIVTDNDDDPIAIHVAASKILFARTYAAVVYLKEGNMEICIPKPIDANLQDMTSAIAALSNVISNPEEYCPGIVE